MLRSLSSLRFLTKTLSQFNKAKVTIAPMRPDEGLQGIYDIKNVTIA